MKKLIEKISFESTFEGTQSFLDIDVNIEGYITLIMEYNEGKGFDIEETEWDELNKTVKKLFKQLNN